MRFADERMRLRILKHRCKAIGNSQMEIAKIILAARELLNSGIIPLTFCMLTVIGHFLVFTAMKYGRGWQHKPGVHAACVLGWVFLAIGIRSGAAAVGLKLEGSGFRIDPLNMYFNVVYFVGALMVFAAFFRCLYLFTPKGVGHWGWIVSAFITALFMVMWRAL